MERGQSKTITESKHKDLKELKKETNYLETKIATEKEKSYLLKSDLNNLKKEKDWIQYTYSKYKDNKTMFSKDLIIEKIQYTTLVLFLLQNG